MAKKKNRKTVCGRFTGYVSTPPKEDLPKPPNPAATPDSEPASAEYFQQKMDEAREQIATQVTQARLPEIDPKFFRNGGSVSERRVRAFRSIYLDLLLRERRRRKSHSNS